MWSMRNVDTTGAADIAFAFGPDSARTYDHELGRTLILPRPRPWPGGLLPRSRLAFVAEVCEGAQIVGERSLIATRDNNTQFG